MDDNDQKILRALYGIGEPSPSLGRYSCLARPPRPAGDVDIGDINDGDDIFGVDDGAQPTTRAPNRSAQQAAAENLIDYVAPRLSTVSPTVPDARIREYQAQMGGITADGKYGPATRARIRELLGLQVVIPDPSGSPPPTSAPAPRSRRGSRPLEEWERDQSLGLQAAAAVGLWGYVTRNASRLRSDVADGTVRSYQTQMGGLVADGKYGRATRGKIASLLPGVVPPELPSSASSPLPAATRPPATTAAPARTPSAMDYPGASPPPTPRPTQPAPPPRRTGIWGFLSGFFS